MNPQMASPLLSVNPMQAQQPGLPAEVIQQLMMLMGGLGRTVPAQPQPQQVHMDAILGGLGGR